MDTQKYKLEKRTEASFQFLQHQFEVILLAVWLASRVLTSKHIFYATQNCASLAHCFGCIQINLRRKQLLCIFFYLTVSQLQLVSQHARDENVASQYGNGSFRTNDWVVSIDRYRTKRLNDLVASLATEPIERKTSRLWQQPQISIGTMSCGRTKQYE